MPLIKEHCFTDFGVSINEVKDIRCITIIKCVLINLDSTYNILTYFICTYIGLVYLI